MNVSSRQNVAGERSNMPKLKPHLAKLPGKMGPKTREPPEPISSSTSLAKDSPTRTRSQQNVHNTAPPDPEVTHKNHGQPGSWLGMPSKFSEDQVSIGWYSGSSGLTLLLAAARVGSLALKKQIMNP